MQFLKGISGIVLDVLINKPKTRDNDNLLYIEVLSVISKKKDLEVLKCPFKEVLENLQNWHLPNIETVGRCRRKVQETYPFLKSEKEIKKIRENREKAFKQYSRKGV